MTIEKLGRNSFSMAVSGLGIFHLVLHNFQSAGLSDSWITLFYTVTAFVFWTGLIVFSLGILFSNRPHLSTVWMTWLISIWIVVRHIPLLISDATSPAQWNFASMALATCGGTFIVAGSFMNKLNDDRKIAIRFQSYMPTGKVLLGLSLLILGFQHVYYAEFIASMIPSWIPGTNIWAWLTGIAMMTSGASFLLNIKVLWSSFSLAMMILSWITLLHIPRIMSQPQDLYEWINAFQALTVVTGALVLYGVQRKSVRATITEKIILIEAELTVTDLKKRASEVDMPTRMDHFEKSPLSRGRKSSSPRASANKR